jgi:hypothetical protein
MSEKFTRFEAPESSVTSGFTLVQSRRIFWLGHVHIT